MKKPVKGEVHWMTENETVKLDHSNIVKNSFIASHPVIPNYKDATIRLGGGNTYVEGEIKVVVSYMYEDGIGE